MKCMLDCQPECWQIRLKKRILAFRQCFRTLSCLTVPVSSDSPVSQASSTQQVLSAGAVVRMTFPIWDTCPELPCCLILRGLGSVSINLWKEATKPIKPSWLKCWCWPLKQSVCVLQYQSLRSFIWSINSRDSEHWSQVSTKCSKSARAVRNLSFLFVCFLMIFYGIPAKNVQPV